MGLGILGILIFRVKWHDFFLYLAAGPWLFLLLYVIIQVIVTLLADAFATRVSLAVTGIKWRFKQTFLRRGSTYLLGVINYALGQGGLGYYLHQQGIQIGRATGTILFMFIININLTFLVAACGILAQNSALTILVYSWIMIISCYLITIVMKPGFFSRNPVLHPLFEAGILGHFTAAIGRMPHVLILVLGHWGALFIWGIAVPFYQALVLIPVILLTAALPITPLGLGTTQVAQVLLFSQYVNLPAAAAREAAITAFSLVYYALAVMTQCGIGLLCWLRLKR